MTKNENRICKVCPKEFKYKFSHHVYCSEECALIARKHRVQEKGRTKHLIKTCEYKECQKSFSTHDRKQRFCSRSCACRVTNKGVDRYKDTHPKKSCAYCDKPLNLSCKKFCDNKCQQKFYWKATVERIKKGMVSNHVQLKRYLVEKFGHKCFMPQCGITEWNGEPVPLVLDHIDGNNENNQISNLRLVCGNCDMQLPTYKSKNKGNGRQWRRDKYKEGKRY